MTNNNSSLLHDNQNTDRQAEYQNWSNPKIIPLEVMTGTTVWVQTLRFVSMNAVHTRGLPVKWEWGELWLDNTSTTEQLQRWSCDIKRQWRGAAAPTWSRNRGCGKNNNLPAVCVHSTVDRHNVAPTQKSTVGKVMFKINQYKSCFPFSVRYVPNSTWGKRKHELS